MFGSSSFTSSAFESATPGPEAPAARKPRQEEHHTCLPVTVRAIEYAVEQRTDTGGELRFHGTEAGVLLLVGCVEAMTRQAASIELCLSDGTGRIKARHYTNDRQSDDLAALGPGSYVSVFGAVRTAPEVHFAVAGMSMVQSADEVSYHMIEAGYAALKLRKGRTEPVTPAPKKQAAEEAVLSPPKVTAAAVEAPAPAETKERLSGSGLKKAVLKFLKKEGEGRAEGLSLAAVCKHVEATPADDVSAALQKLVEAGEAYTTIDEEHFLPL